MDFYEVKRTTLKLSLHNLFKSSTDWPDWMKYDVAKFSWTLESSWRPVARPCWPPSWGRASPHRRTRSWAFPCTTGQRSGPVSRPSWCRPCPWRCRSEWTALLQLSHPKQIISGQLRGAQNRGDWWIPIYCSERSGVGVHNTQMTSTFYFSNLQLEMVGRSQKKSRPLEF